MSLDGFFKKKTAGFHNLVYIDSITKEFHEYGGTLGNLGCKDCLRRMYEMKGRVITAQEERMTL